MLKKILAALGLLVVALVAVVATRPARYRVERSLVIRESPAILFRTVADFHTWDAWSPWASLDPARKTTFAGEPLEVGSTYAWAGDDRVGEGRLTLTEVHAPSQLKMKLELFRPWRSTSEAVFDFYTETRGTRVVWILRGRLDFRGKAMSLFKDMDRLVGPDFDRGLANLRTVAEEATVPR